MDEKTKRYAELYGIRERMIALEKDLMSIRGIPSVEFDIRYYEVLHQVILLPKYDLKNDCEEMNAEVAFSQLSQSETVEMSIEGFMALKTVRLGLNPVQCSPYSLLEEVIAICRKHGLYPSGDRIEDYGDGWYIVRTCGKDWASRFIPLNMVEYRPQLKNSML